MRCTLGAGEDGPAVVVPVNEEVGVAEETDYESHE